jgi:hypothetical protein
MANCRKIIFLNSALLVLLGLAFSCQAIDIPNPLIVNTFQELLGTIVNFIFILSLPIAIIMIVIAGFLFVTAMGEPEKIQKAKNMLIWVLIGLAVVFLAKGMITLFYTVFNIQVP